MANRKKMRWAIGLGVTLAVVAGVALGLQQVRMTGEEIPTARVRRGNLEVKVYTRGELRPARTAMLVAPQVPGTLQIVHLARPGSHVQAGQVVVEFDPSEQEYNLEQNRSELLQAEQEITKLKADTAVQAAQDRVAMLKARFDVRRAELEVSRNELVSAIDAQKNNMALAEARRRLAQLEKDIESRAASSQASLAVLEEKRNKARLEMMQAQQNIENMRLRAPMSGLFNIKENRDSTGGFFTTGMVIPEYRVGDLSWPGRTIAEVLETQQMEILAKVSENDRANLQLDQPVEVVVDALPGETLRGKVKTLAQLASRGDWWRGTGGTRKFDVTFELTSASERLRPGVTAQVIIVGEQVRDALHLPRQALFEKDGKPVVYVRAGRGFEAREVQLKHRTETYIVIEGLEEGAEVALANPETGRGRPRKALAGPMVSAGGAP